MFAPNPTHGFRWERHWTLAIVAVIVAVIIVAAGAGFIGGTTWTRHRTDLTGWHTAVAQTGMRQIAIEYDGWTYGAPEAVDSWIDRYGTWHDSGWPQCLRVPPGREVTVRFQARVVTIDAITTRPIVSIDCTPAG
jgi:ABC-type branched-subunit amino acid transport system permease subunit